MKDQTQQILHIPIRRTHQSQIHLVDFTNLHFGKIVSDHMFIAKYSNGHWHDAAILPYGDISLAPTALCFHYGQTVFEGMKAFRMQDGNISIFRMDKHFERINKSLERMCMALLPVELFYASIKQLVATDALWVPSLKGSSLYLRPFMIATEERFGVKESDEYLYTIITGPVPPLYNKPIKIKVETQYVRAVKGGTGYAKCGGNYGGSLYPTKLARQEGYNAVLWTDGRDNKYIEESGTMNMLFIIDDILVTPALSDSILDGITRDAVLTIANDLGIKTEERAISVDEVIVALETNRMSEAFVAGTAAVLTPVELIGAYGKNYHLPSMQEHSVMNQIKTTLEHMRTGIEADIHQWNTIIKI
jgi:branched-chain amino acid aminotransferase